MLHIPDSQAQEGRHSDRVLVGIGARSVIAESLSPGKRRWLKPQQTIFFVLISYTLSMVTAYMFVCQIKCDARHGPFRKGCRERKTSGKSCRRSIPKRMDAGKKGGRILIEQKARKHGRVFGEVRRRLSAARRDEGPFSGTTSQNDWQRLSISSSTAGCQDSKSPSSGARDENSGKAVLISWLAESWNP